MRFTVGLKLKTKADHIVIDAEDALIAALRVKADHPDARDHVRAPLQPPRRRPPSAAHPRQGRIAVIPEFAPANIRVRQRCKPSPLCCMSSLKMLVQLGARRRAGEALEAAGLRDLLGRAHEAAPGRPRQRAADADAARAERRRDRSRVRSLGQPISTLTGFGATALITAPICSRVVMPGA